MKNRLSVFDALCVITLVSFSVIAHFYAEKNYHLSDPSIKIIKSKPIEILGMFLMIVCIFFGLLIQEWWHKRYPPRPKSTDSPDGAPPSHGDTDATDYPPPT